MPDAELQKIGKSTLQSSDGLSSGSTLLNLACSGSVFWAMVKGKYYWFVGDSSSGKTMIALTLLAEASINKHFDDYELIFDDVEDGALMDKEKFFGSRLANRLQPPAFDEKGNPVYSTTIEEFYFNLDDRILKQRKRGGKPFIYLLDSMDSLSSKYEGQKFEEKKKAARKGTESKGDYGDGKAKINSTFLRRIVADLRDSGSILIILSQTRDNIDGGMFSPPTVHAGGHALKFYATWQLWSSLGRKIKKTVDEKDRQVGITSRVSIKKNRLSGKEWTVEIPIYYSAGVDDVGSCVDFLIDEKHWSKDSRGKIDASEFNFEGTRDKLVEHIETENLEVDLRDLVGEVWDAIEQSCVVQRKNKYQV